MNVITVIGAMLAAIVVSTADGRIRMPTRLVIAVQGVVGFMIASTIPPTILSDLARDWPLLLIGLVGVVLGTTAIGLALMRSGLLPGATGVWGMAPGASTPMILMADENGADARLVAIMHKVLRGGYSSQTVAAFTTAMERTSVDRPLAKPEFRSAEDLVTNTISRTLRRLGRAPLPLPCRAPEAAH